jgi:hypothetical protein
MTPVLNTAEKIYLGNSAASAVYLGETKVWPKFSPTSLSGLAIWFDASQLGLPDGADVSPWPNLGSSGPGTIVATPAPQISVNKLKGQRLVRFFNGGGRMRMTATGVQWAHTLAYVGRMVPGGYGAGRLVCAAYPQPNFLIGFWNGYEDVGYSTTGSFFVPDMRTSVTTNWKLYSSDADASPEFGGAGYHPRMFKDGVLLSSGGQADGYCQMADAWWDTFNISGYDPTGTAETCDCEVAEICLYDRKLPDADRQQVEDYLRNKWLA